jgi:methylated-DNA-[protein]-cysteine S-methyltransferase
MSSPKAAEARRPRTGARSAPTGYALFTTGIGRCGIVWNDIGIVGVQLPETTVTATRRRIVERHSSAISSDPPPFVRAAMDSISRHLAGGRSELPDIRLDMAGVTPFRRRVYEEARLVPAGTTASYGELADRLGQPDAARAVGQALGHNPFAIVVPCHRVVAAGGKIGGFSADGGTHTKRRILRIEGLVPTGADTPPTNQAAT